MGTCETITINRSYIIDALNVLYSVINSELDASQRELASQTIVNLQKELYKYDKEK